MLLHAYRTTDSQNGFTDQRQGDKKSKSTRIRTKRKRAYKEKDVRRKTDKYDRTEEDR